MENNQNKVGQWTLFLATLLVLAGLYGIARVVINVTAFDKYPMDGVYPNLPFVAQTSAIYPGPYGYQREADCIANFVYYPYVPTRPDGTPREFTKEEKEQQEFQKKQTEVQKQNCLDGVAEARSKAKVNDISQSILLLVLGGGFYLARRILVQKANM